MIKQTLIAAAACISMAAMASPANKANTMYVGLNAGSASTYYKNSINRTIKNAELPVVSTDYSHGNGSFAAGLDVGYNLTKHFAAEIGGFYLQHAKFHGSFQQENFHGKVKPWNLYLTGKMSAPLAMHISIFGKIGIGYQHIKYDVASSITVPDLTGDRSERHLGPVFAVGAEYSLTSALSANVQYMRFAGNHNEEITNPNIYTLGIAYNFAV